jgi:uncharacterized membrane protein
MVLSEVMLFILGALVIIVIPGYALTRALFARRELDAMEGIASTLALGLLAMPTILIILNKTIRMRITAFNTSLVILTIIAYTLMYIGYLRRENNKEGNGETGQTVKKAPDESSKDRPRH